MATGTSVSDHGTSTAVGEKLFYKIGEVSRLTGLPAYVLRFWESEFGFLRPQKTRGRQRKYTDRKSTRLNSSHLVISYAVFCLKKKKNPRSRPVRTLQSRLQDIGRCRANIDAASV